MVRKKHLRKFVILPFCLCFLEATEEIVVYKLGMISNPWWRTAAILGMYLVGFSLVGFLISPLLERWLELAYSTSKKQAGVFGELMIIAGIFLALFFLFYFIYIIGPAGFLPASWKNPPPPILPG